MELKEILLLSNDLSSTAQFYSEILNVKPVDKNDNELAFLIGKTKLRFQVTDIKQPIYHLAIEIPNNKLEEAFNWLKERTTILPVTQDSNYSKFEAWNAASFYFYDNNGSILELICRHDVTNESDLPFDETQFLYISEIGLVSNEVEHLAEKLTATYQLDYYARQPKQKDFIVIGDEKGLLILVSSERNWYPTTRKAESFPIAVLFIGSDNIEHKLNI